VSIAESYLVTGYMWVVDAVHDLLTLFQRDRGLQLGLVHPPNFTLTLHFHLVPNLQPQQLLDPISQLLAHQVEPFFAAVVQSATEDADLRLR
jgi:hypothetical protein